MRFVYLAVLCAGLLSFNSRTTEPSKPHAEAAWAEILKGSRPPTPPAEWGNNKPTPEQETEWKKQLAGMAESVANKAHKFYETYPSHAKAEEARAREKSFRKQAASLRSAVDSPKDPANTASNQERVLPQDPKVDPAFAKRMDEVMARVRERREKEGPAGVLDEFAKAGRALTEEFPNELEPWKLLYTAAMNTSGPKSLEIYKYMAAKGPPELKEIAEPEVKRAEAVGKPLKLAFKDVNGGNVDIAKLKDKVVLIDFWATWCGPCIASLPELIKVYETFHGKGLEVIGINFDDDCEDMKRFTRKNKMLWPQFCDGMKWENALNKEFGIRAIPTMYLVDKKGVLRDLNARENLPEKVEALLKE
jgi:thiol-disulfide isomerase/thioredoxin